MRYLLALFYFYRCLEYDGSIHRSMRETTMCLLTTFQHTRKNRAADVADSMEGMLFTAVSRSFHRMQSSKSDIISACPLI